MSSNRTNYPRPKLEEKTVENYQAWQWSVLVIAIMAPTIIQFWLPSLTTSYSKYKSLVIAAEIFGIGVMAVCPFLFGKGSLMRATLDRARELSSGALMFVTGSIAAIHILPLFFHPLAGITSGGTVVRLILDHVWSRSLFYPLGISILHSIATYYFYLLQLTIPGDMQRLKTFSATLVSHIVFTMSGTYMYAMIFPFASNLGPHTSSMTRWIAESILSPLMYFVTLWMLERISFPSFRPILVMIGISLAWSLVFRSINGIELMAIQLVSLLILTCWVLMYCPDALRLARKDEEALQSI